MASQNGSSLQGNDAFGTTNNESPPRRSYEPKYSASTEMILKRLRGEGGLLAPNSTLSLGTIDSGNPMPRGFQDARRSVLEAMKTSMNMGDSTPSDVSNTPLAKKSKGPRKSNASRTSTPLNRTPNAKGASSAKGKSNSRKTKTGTKRKRVKDESESAESDGAMSGLGGDSDSDIEMPDQTPATTLSGRKVVKPTQFVPMIQEGPPRKKGPGNYNKKTGRNVEQALCKRCSRGHSPTTNMIVFCDGCNNGYHQMCHDPAISNEIIKDESSAWFCKECVNKKAARGQRHSQSVRVSEPAATPIPTPVSSKSSKPKPSNNWGRMNIDQKRAYFTAMPVQHLVACLVHATSLHPDLPLPFLPNTQSETDAHLQMQQQNTHRQGDRHLDLFPQQPFQPSTYLAAGHFISSETNPEGIMDFLRKDTSGDSPSRSSSFHSASSQPPSQPQHVESVSALFSHQAPYENPASRESTPASPPYPRPGTGMMARLKPEDEDLSWLVGEGEDDKAFSHFLVDHDGNLEKVTENA